MPHRLLLPQRAALRSLVFSACMLAGAASLPAAAAMPPADEQAIQQVVLNDALLDRLLAVKRDAKAQKIPPQAINPAQAGSLDSMAKLLDPRVPPILARHGLSARDYWATALAVARAQMAASPQAAAMGAAAMKGTTPANVAYVRSHVTKFRALSAEDGEDDAQ